MSGLLGERAQRLGTGRIAGRLYEAGPYPAAVPGDDGHVRGEVHRLEDPDRSLPVLDRYERCTPDGQGLYRREEVTVEMQEGEPVTAWACFYNRDTGSLAAISSGDYLAAREGAEKEAGAPDDAGAPEEAGEPAG